MSATTLRPSDTLLPPPPGGLAPGAALALAAHAALVAALALGVQWRASAPDVVAAELWAAVPQQAAPPPVEVPAPPPPAQDPTPAPAPAPAPAPVAAPPLPPAEPDAQIAIERARREQAQQKARELEQQQARQRKAQLEREKLEARLQLLREQQARQAREAREAKAAEARVAQELERRREENLRRLLGQAGTGAPSSTGTAAAAAAPSQGYAGKLVAAIRPNIVFTDTVAGNPATEVEVRTAPGGTVMSRRVVRSSGHRDWDEAVLRAIDRTGTLPRDTDGRVPDTLVITFRPNG